MSRRQLEWVARQPFPDATTRLRARLPATDVGKFARQLDDQTIWLLKDNKPMSWTRQDFGLEVTLPGERTASSQSSYKEMASAFWSGSWSLLNVRWVARLHVMGSLDVKLIRESDGVTIWEQTGIASSSDLDVPLNVTGNLPTDDDVILLLVRKASGSGGEVVSGRLSLA
jgi:hypothetical protein